MLTLAAAKLVAPRVRFRARLRADAPNKGVAAAPRAIVTGLTLLILAGCSSETLPTPLSADQLKAISATHFKATVGVRPYSARVYSDYLVEYLRKTGLFDEVAPLDVFRTSSTFIARVDRGIYGTATIPMFTIMTVGVIPTIVEEEHGLDFSLLPSSTPKKPIAIKFNYKGPSTLGWWAFYRGFLPNETSGRADQNARFVQSLAWHIVEHENDISNYTK
jgi:hypothetical protein